MRAGALYLLLLCGRRQPRQQMQCRVYATRLHVRLSNAAPPLAAKTGSPDSSTSRGGRRTRVHKRQAQQVAVSERVALQTSQQEKQ